MNVNAALSVAVVQAQAQAARTAGFTDIGAMLDAVQPDLVSVCLASTTSRRR